MFLFTSEDKDVLRIAYCAKHRKNCLGNIFQLWRTNCCKHIA